MNKKAFEQGFMDKAANTPWGMVLPMAIGGGVGVAAGGTLTNGNPFGAGLGGVIGALGVGIPSTLI